MRGIICATLIAIAIFGQTTPAPAELPALIPIDTLFPDWAIIGPAADADGNSLAYMLVRDNITELHVRSLDTADNVIVAVDTGFGLRDARWARDNAHLVYNRRLLNQSALHIFSYNVITRETRNLTPDSAVSFFLGQRSRRLPTRLGVYRYDGIRAVVDACVIDLDSGRVVSCEPNPGDIDFWAFDQELRPRAAVTIPSNFNPQPRILARTIDDTTFVEVYKIKGSDRYDMFSLYIFDTTLYVVDSRDGDKKTLKAYDLGTKKRRTLVEDETVDVSGFFTIDESFFGRVGYDRPAWVPVDSAFQSQCQFLNQHWGGAWHLMDTDSTRTLWSVVSDGDICTPKYFLYDSKRLAQIHEMPLFPELDSATLSSTMSFKVKSRGNVIVPCYLTLPRGLEAKNLPLVVKVHGGPHSRDEWGFDAENQFLANRGWAVLQVNFRGSDGYGEKYLQSGFGEWSKGIIDDIFSAINKVVSDGTIDRDRVAIYGSSYGGYAALMAVAREPNRFVGGVAFAPVTDLIDLLSFSQGSKTYEQYEAIAYTIAGALTQNELKKSSPINRIRDIRVPFLLAHGSRDTRIPVRQTERLADALQKDGRRVELVIYPQATHDWMSVKDQRDFAVRLEAFLTERLGSGR